jgi:hypothetical protein
MEVGPRPISRDCLKPTAKKFFYDPLFGDSQDFGSSSGSILAFDRSEVDEDEYHCSSQPIRRHVILRWGEVLEFVNS